MTTGTLKLFLFSVLIWHQVASIDYEEKTLWSFESGGAQGWMADSMAQLSVVDSGSTHGTLGLSVRFPQPQARFSRTGSIDLSGWEKLKIDALNSGDPFVLTLRVRDAAGKSYTSWYQVVARGRSVLEYNLRGLSSVVPDRGQVVALDLARIIYIEWRLDQEDGPPSAAVFDNIRLSRGHEPFRAPSGAALGPGAPRAVESVPNNLLSNGDFELGFQGWKTWGEWDGGAYRFGTADGSLAFSGAASAEILAERVGRGGIWTQVELPAGGRVQLRLMARGVQGAHKVRVQLLGAGGFTEDFEIGTEWTSIVRDIVAQKGEYLLYLYHVGPGNLYLDAVHLTSTVSPGSAPVEEAPGPRPVRVEGDRLTVDGRGFFPIGIYGVENIEADISGTGFNTVIGNEGSGGASQWYARAAEAGVMTLANLTGLMRGHRAAAAPLIAARVKEQPSLLGYYLCDEPDHARWNVTPAEIRQARHLLAREDPDHPSIVLVMAWHRSMAYQYADAADIIASDPYSIDDMDKPVRSVRWMDDAQSEPQPVWVVLQLGWGDTPPATPQAMVGQTYASIATGADGIFWFERGWGRRHPEQWQVVVDLSLELAAIHDELTWPEATQQPVFSDPRVIGVLKEGDSEKLLITVNKTLEATGDVEILIDGLGTRTGQSLFDDGTVQFTEGRLHAHYGPGERRVYRLGPAAGEPAADDGTEDSVQREMTLGT